MEAALQAIVFGQEFVQNLDRDLRATGDSGFKAIEIAPYVVERVGVRRLAEAVQAASLRISAVHGSIRRLQKEKDFDTLCKQIARLGCRDFISSGILRGGDRAAYTHTAALLVSRARHAKRKHGIQLHYHHYDFEFAKRWEGETAFELLVTQTEPDVFFVLDTYWLLAAKVRLRQLWQTMGEQCRIIHIKDGDPGKRTFCPLGDGSAGVADTIEFLKEEAPQLTFLTYEQDFASTTSVSESVESSGEWFRVQGI